MIAASVSNGKTWPVCWILTVNVTDTSCEHCNAEISNSLALVWICALAHTYNAVLFTADRTNFALDRKTKLICNVNEFSDLARFSSNG